MRAMRFHEYGGPSVIVEDDLPIPAPGPGEVLVRVAGTGFNPSEVGLRRGLLRGVFALDLPYTMGAEVAGTAGGERVVGRVDAGGAAAEYVVAPASVLVPAPKEVPLAWAAALPIAGLTAWQAIVEHAGVRAGHRVLINGAGGGVGGFAVQIARHLGAYVIAAASPRSAATVRAQGAHEVVGYGAAVEPVDVVIHLVPGPAEGLPEAGRLISATVPAGQHFVTRNDPGQLAELVALVDAGVIRPDVTTRPLADLAAVHRDAEARRLRGKTVLVP